MNVYSLHSCLGSEDAIEIKIKFLTPVSLMLEQGKTLESEGLIGLTVYIWKMWVFMDV